MELKFWTDVSGRGNTIAAPIQAALGLMAAQWDPKQRLAAITYTVEAEGRPVVLFKAVSYFEARELIKELWFRSDLKRKKNGSSAVWDGRARLSVRVASVTEATSAALALAHEANQTDGVALVYLNVR